MKKVLKPIFIIIYYMIITISYSQNLVKNPGFEEYWYLQKENAEGDSLAYGRYPCKYWSRITETTPDYFNKNQQCKKYSIPDNFLGHHPALTGDAYIGFVPISWDGGMEPISGELLMPLNNNKSYLVSFDYRFVGSDFPLMLEKLEIYFSKDLRMFGPQTTVSFYYTITPEIVCNVSKPDKLNNDAEWHKTSYTYIAKGGEKYITIGIFYQNKKFNKLIREYQTIFPRSYNPKEESFLRKNQGLLYLNPDYNHLHSFAESATYYFIDNVSVELITK